MSTITKPTVLPTWVPDSTSVSLAVPPQAVINSGFQPNQPVPAQWINQLLHNLGAWVGYLNESTNSTTLASTLDDAIRLIGGGTWSYSVASGVLAWSAPFVLAIPSTADTQNQAAAGQVTLPPGSIAYVQANLPYSTTADAVAGSPTLSNLGYEAGIVVGQAVSGPGIAQGTTVQAVKGSTVTLSQPATQAGTQVTVTFVGSGALVVKAAPAATFVPGPTTILLARATDAACAVGVGATEMWLRDGEQRSLMGVGYAAVVSAPAGVAITARQLVYLSFGLSDGRTAGSAYPVDVNTAQGATRGQPIGFAHSATAQGATCRLVNGGFVAGFTGLTPGFIYYADPATPGGITPTAPTTAGQYIAPVGIAVSATVLLVQIAPARPVTTTLNSLTVTGPTTLNTVTTQSITNAAGIKTAINMGSFWSTNAQASAQILQTVLFNGAQSSVGSMDRVVLMPYSGSIMGYQTRCFSSVAFGATFNVLRRGSDGITNTVANFGATLAANAYQNGGGTSLRNTITFQANEVLFVRLANPPSGANVQVELDLIVEFQS